MKKFLFPISIIIVLLGCFIYFANYFKEYPIKEVSSDSELTNVIDQFYENNSNLVIKRTINIENNYKAVVFTVGKKVGIAVLKKGLFDRYKIMYVSTQGNTAYSHISKTNIFIVYGKKPNRNMNNLKVTAFLNGMHNPKSQEEVLNFKLDNNPYYLQYKHLTKKAVSAIVTSDSYEFNTE